MENPIVGDDCETTVTWDGAARLLAIKWKDAGGTVGGVSLALTPAILIGLEIRKITLDLAKAADEAVKAASRPATPLSLNAYPPNDGCDIVPDDSLIAELRNRGYEVIDPHE